MKLRHICFLLPWALGIYTAQAQNALFNDAKPLRIIDPGRFENPLLGPVEIPPGNKRSPGVFASRNSHIARQRTGVIEWVMNLFLSYFW